MWTVVVFYRGGGSRLFEYSHEMSARVEAGNLAANPNIVEVQVKAAARLGFKSAGAVRVRC